MRFPRLETLVACTAVGAVFLGWLGNMAHHSGYAFLLAFNLCVLLGIFRYGFGTWNLERHDPLGNVVGLVMMATGASILVVWLAWTQGSEKLLFLNEGMGLAVGFAGGLVITPGFAQETLRRRIGPGAALPLLVEALYCGDADLKQQAAVGVAANELPDAAEAVPPLLVMADGGPQEQLHACAALASLGVPTDDAAAVFDRELKSSHFRAASSPLVKYPRATVEFLRGRLREKSAFVLRRACEVVAALGPVAEATRPELLELVSTGDRQVRRSASLALAALSGTSLVRLLLRQWPRFLILAVVVLGLYGCSYTPLGRLHGYCLARDFGGAQGDALLVRALGDSWNDTRNMAEKALQERGREAEPALREGLNSPSEEVRQRCQTLLDKLPAP